jgi:hypothetical protein
MVPQHKSTIEKKVNEIAERGTSKTELGKCVDGKLFPYIRRFGLQLLATTHLFLHFEYRKLGGCTCFLPHK